MSGDENPKVMVVDDDENVLVVVREVFESEGIPVITAVSGKECLTHLDSGFRGVILMDIMMPEMDGWDTIREIVSQGYAGEGTLIVMLTAKDVPDRKMEGLQEYVIDYITKPFDPDELVALVKEYLGYLA